MSDSPTSPTLTTETPTSPYLTDAYPIVNNFDVQNILRAAIIQANNPAEFLNAFFDACQVYKPNRDMYIPQPISPLHYVGDLEFSSTDTYHSTVYDESVLQTQTLGVDKQEEQLTSITEFIDEPSETPKSQEPSVEDINPIELGQLLSSKTVAESDAKHLNETTMIDPPALDKPTETVKTIKRTINRPRILNSLETPILPVKKAKETPNSTDYTKIDKIIENINKTFKTGIENILRDTQQNTQDNSLK